MPKKIIFFLLLTLLYVSGCNNGMVPKKQDPIVIEKIIGRFENMAPEYQKMIWNGTDSGMTCFLNIIIAYAERELTPSDVESIKLIGNGCTFKMRISKEDFTEGRVRPLTYYFSNNVRYGISELRNSFPLNGWEVRITLTDGQVFKKKVDFNKPGTTEKPGNDKAYYIKTEDNGNRLSNSYQMIKRAQITSAKIIGTGADQKISVYFNINNDTMIADGVVLLFDTKGSYMGSSPFFMKNPRIPHEGLNNGSPIRTNGANAMTFAVPDKLKGMNLELLRAVVILYDGKQYFPNDDSDTCSISAPLWLLRSRDS